MDTSCPGFIGDRIDFLSYYIFHGLFPLTGSFTYNQPVWHWLPQWDLELRERAFLNTTSQQHSHGLINSTVSSFTNVSFYIAHHIQKNSFITGTWFKVWNCSFSRGGAVPIVTTWDLGKWTFRALQLWPVKLQLSYQVLFRCENCSQGCTWCALCDWSSKTMVF